MSSNNKKGFTLIELLIVISIIGVLASVVLSSVRSATQKAYLSRTKGEFKSMATALELYYGDHDDYPPDVSRGLPPGLGEYLAGNQSNNWPDAPWPNSIYDWDNWDDPDHPGLKIYQISVRFCPVNGQLSDCHFPNEIWAANFGLDSSAYYCISGICRSHINQSVDYPGYCLNCGN